MGKVRQRGNTRVSATLIPVSPETPRNPSFTNCKRYPFWPNLRGARTVATGWCGNQGKGLEEADMLKEFKEFALKGNMIDLAVGIIIGVAFGAIVSSLVDDIFMPLIGLVIGDIDFSSLVLGPMNIGLFINAVVKFIIIAIALFFVVKGMNSLKRKEEPAPVAPPEEVRLLTEIRDLLKK